MPLRALITFAAMLFAIADTGLPWAIPGAKAGVPPSISRDCDLPNEAGQSTIVTRWNLAALQAICLLEDPQPTIVSRSLYLLHVAMYDAWTAYEGNAVPVYAEVKKQPFGPDAETHKAEAISFAALEILFTDLPGQQDLFFDRLAAEGYSEDWFIEPPEGSAAELGIAVARAVLDARNGDGANAEKDFRDNTGYAPANPPDLPLSEIDPNRWQPLIVPDLTPQLIPRDFDPVTFDSTDYPHWTEQSFVTPHWPWVSPFALDSADQFRPGPPPYYGDDALYTDASGRTMTSHQAWVDQTTEVMLYQANLTEEQKVIAQVFSQDGPYYALPPGHWNFFAQKVSLRDGHGLDEDVRMFFALNAAMLDAGIVAWDAKREYDYIRPVTAIHFLYQGTELFGWRGPGNGFGQIDATDWRPYQWTAVVAPAHPEYVSGHATFCAAGGEALRRFTDSDQFFQATVKAGDFNEDGLMEPVGYYVMKPGDGMFDPDSPSRTVELVWETFSEVVEQCGIARLYDGVHIMDSNLRGQEMGRAAGALAFDRARAFWTGTAAKP